MLLDILTTSWIMSRKVWSKYFKHGVTSLMSSLLKAPSCRVDQRIYNAYVHVICIYSI